MGLFNIPALREVKIKNLEHGESAFEEIMNKFNFLLRPSPYMLNNLFITVCCYLYPGDPVNLRPKNCSLFVLSKFRGFVIICFRFCHSNPFFSHTWTLLGSQLNHPFKGLLLSMVLFIKDFIDHITDDYQSLLDLGFGYIQVG